MCRSIHRIPARRRNIQLKSPLARRSLWQAKHQQLRFWPINITDLLGESILLIESFQERGHRDKLICTIYYTLMVCVTLRWRVAQVEDDLTAAAAMSLFSLKRDSICRARIKCNLLFFFCFWSTRCLNITFVEFLASCFFPACGLVRLAVTTTVTCPIQSVVNDNEKLVFLFESALSCCRGDGDLRMIIGPYFKHTALRDAMNLWLNALISRWSFVLACWESSAHANKPPISIRLDTKNV